MKLTAVCRNYACKLIHIACSRASSSAKLISFLYCLKDKIFKMLFLTPYNLINMSVTVIRNFNVLLSLTLIWKMHGVSLTLALGR